MYIWTNEEIEKILIQLDKQQIPFPKYSFTRKNDRLRLLGRGGFALVYEAKERNSSSCEYAMKVIGFGEKHVDSGFFKSTVKAQKNAGFLQNNVVKIYDYAESFVWIDEDNCVIQVKENKEAFSKEELPKGNCLKLQFILMEKLESVLHRDKYGKANLTSERLAGGDEKEILKLAYDIGTALSYAHKQNVLHRDVKLENIFYEGKGKHYKLGDFGIAKVTDDGMASTVAFTKGYGAPEVIGSLEEKYDNTADIYSFGILLYVLLNELRFPDSDNYDVNSRIQYQPGYVLPRPANGSEELYLIIDKMCRYDPEDRYQSMEEALNDLENLIFHSDIGYRRAHKDASLAVGVLLYFGGVLAWKLTFKPELLFELPKAAYLFLVLSVGKWILSLFKKNVIKISVILFGVGVYLLVSSGFSWANLILFVCIIFSSGNFAGLFGGTVLTLKVVSLVTQQNQQILQNGQDYRWIAVALLSLAAVMILQYYVLQDRDYTLTVIYLKKYRFWFLVFLIYAALLLNGIIMNGKTADMCSGIIGERLTEELMTYDLIKVGMIGMGFSIVWIIREKVLNNMDRRRKKFVCKK